MLIETPPDIATLCGFLALLVTVVCSGRYLASRPAVLTLCLDDWQDIDRLLSEPIPVQLHRRAVSNARLARAFRITNTFVFDSVDVHKAFTREARRLILSAGSSPAAWSRFAECALNSVDQYCIHSSSKPTKSSAFDQFIQFVAFRTILVTMFDVDADSSPEDILIVTQGINDLWRLSKTSTDFPPDMLNAIDCRLRRWIPGHSNPLDFILPVFETMWRVIAVTAAYVHQDPDMRCIFIDFLAEPTAEHFERFTKDMPSVEAVIAEAMRLHPPTRRIHRASVLQHIRVPLIPQSIANYLCRQGPGYVADIGALHRREDIWGDDSKAFKPMRHHPESITERQREAFMPFGHGRLKCVASGWAPHAAGLMVGAVLNRVGERLEIREGHSVGGREGWEGWEIQTMKGE